MKHNDRHRENKSMMVREKESPRFAFLIISANTHLAHLQVAQTHTQTKPAKEPNSPTTQQ
jgi:hypothetical protein